VTYPTNLMLHTDPHPILRQKADPVTVFDRDLAYFVAHMFEKMMSWRGVGLAAPQVGVSKRIFVTCYSQVVGNPAAHQKVWINPYLERPKGTAVNEEGCLSVRKEHNGRVERFNTAVLHYQDLTGAKKKKFFNIRAGDYIGVIIQHELDHLDGILFIDKVLKPKGTSA